MYRDKRIFSDVFIHSLFIFYSLKKVFCLETIYNLFLKNIFIFIVDIKFTGLSMFCGTNPSIAR